MNMGKKKKKNKWKLVIEAHTLLWRLQTPECAEALQPLLFLTPTLTLTLVTP